MLLLFFFSCSWHFLQFLLFKWFIHNPKAANKTGFRSVILCPVIDSSQLLNILWLQQSLLTGLVTITVHNFSKCIGGNFEHNPFLSLDTRTNWRDRLTGNSVHIRTQPQALLRENNFTLVELCWQRRCGTWGQFLFPLTGPYNYWDTVYL